MYGTKIADTYSNSVSIYCTWLSLIYIRHWILIAEVTLYYALVCLFIYTRYNLKHMYQVIQGDFNQDRVEGKVENKIEDKDENKVKNICS